MAGMGHPAVAVGRTKERIGSEPDGDAASKRQRLESVRPVRSFAMRFSSPEPLFAERNKYRRAKKLERMPNRSNS